MALKKTRFPIPSKINLGFGFTVKTYELGPKDYARAYNASHVDRNPDGSLAFSAFEMDEHGRFSLSVYLKKHMKYADKVRWFTHEVGHHYIDWMDQVRMLAEKS